MGVDRLGPYDTAYLAGFVDGEGSIGIVAHNKPNTAGGKGRRTPHYRLVIGVTNTDIAVLQWIHDRWGGSIFAKSTKNAKWAPSFELRITNREACFALLLAIQPHVKVKARQVELGLAFLNLGLARVTFSARGKTWPRRIQHPEDVEVRETLKRQMNALNLRGPVDA